jgi:predicted dehydrogenase
MIGVRVRAVVDANPLLAAQTAKPHIGLAAFSTLKDALQAESFDIVDICLPPHQQGAAVEAALRAGSHVLCEKPLGSSCAEARSLIALAHDRERLLMTGFAHRFHPPLLLMKEMLDNDDFGTPLQFHCRFSGFWAESETERTDDVLIETATHGVDLFRYFCGEATFATGKAKRTNPNSSVPDTATLLLESERGTLGVVEASWNAPGGHNRVEIYGTAGACILDYQEETLRYMTAEQPVWQSRWETGPNRYERLLAHVADAVRGLQSPLTTGEDGLRARELCETVVREI